MNHRSTWITSAIAVAAIVVATTTFTRAADPGGKDTKKAKSRAERTSPLGYDDTPLLPDGKWRVHDIKRPHPAVINPGTPSSQQRPGRPPSDAIVLFDGKDLSKWSSRGTGENKGKVVDASWKVENGYVEAAGSESIFTKEKFGDVQLHLEWAAPAKIEGSGQWRGNSGVLLMNRYEIQVLDSYENPTYADGQAAAIYGQYPPLVNASRKPGEWQMYDIVFEAPRFEGEKLVKPAYVTVFHNGVLMHHRKEIVGRMAHKVVGTYAPHAPEEPLGLQNHDTAVRYRNIWMRRLTGYDQQQ
ncbi:MAG: 3-keto-disaccharide hydrolase [Bryobacteraceae bacterium]